MPFQLTFFVVSIINPKSKQRLWLEETEQEQCQQKQEIQQKQCQKLINYNTNNILHIKFLAFILK